MGPPPEATPPTSPALVPHGIVACLFDLDGVLTRTAEVHAHAWKEMFDAFLRADAAARGIEYVEFRLPEDYTSYVDGKLRQDGVRSFLASRGIVLPEGAPDDPPAADTVYGLGTRKNDMVLALIHRDGVAVYERSITYVKAVRDAGLPRAVVSASRNCQQVLQAAGIEDLFDVRIDGTVAETEHLGGKPAPDMFLAAAHHLSVAPAAAAVYEDAVAGVQAGHAGAFGWVVGVDRVGGGHADALNAGGADVVVDDLGDLIGSA
jgi:beta-phosphoglucomutase family hydrolase